MAGTSSTVLCNGVVESSHFLAHTAVQPRLKVYFCDGDASLPQARARNFLVRILCSLVTFTYDLGSLHRFSHATMPAWYIIRKYGSCSPPLRATILMNIIKKKFKLVPLLCPWRLVLGVQRLFSDLYRRVIIHKRNYTFRSDFPAHRGLGVGGVSPSSGDLPYD